MHPLGSNVVNLRFFVGAHQSMIERPREHTRVLPYNGKEKYAIIS